jgi:hypothetical protein
LPYFSSIFFTNAFIVEQAQNRLLGSFGSSEVNQPQNIRRFVGDHVIVHVCLENVLKSLLVTVCL